FQIQPSSSAKLAYVQVFIDYHAAGRVSSKQDSVHDLLHLRIEIAAFYRWSKLRWLECFGLGEGAMREMHLELRSPEENFLRVNFSVLVHQLEHIAENTHCFRRAQDEITAGVERVVKDRQCAFLQLWA